MMACEAQRCDCYLPLLAHRSRGVRTVEVSIGMHSVGGAACLEAE